MYSINTEWLRELTAFMAVASTARADAARFTSAAASSAVVIRVRMAPTTVDGPPVRTIASSLSLNRGLSLSCAYDLLISRGDGGFHGSCRTFHRGSCFFCHGDPGSNAAHQRRRIAWLNGGSHG
jgi:hypothetical protein